MIDAGDITTPAPAPKKEAPAPKQEPALPKKETPTPKTYGNSDLDDRQQAIANARKASEAAAAQSAAKAEQERLAAQKKQDEQNAAKAAELQKQEQAKQASNVKSISGTAASSLKGTPGEEAFGGGITLNDVAAFNQAMSEKKESVSTSSSSTSTSTSNSTSTSTSTNTSTNTSTQQPVVNPTPQSPPTPPPAPTTTVVKVSPTDTILYDEDAVSIETMSELLFENVGGQELISIVRSDTVNGQNIAYVPIKNLTEIQNQYNPNNIISMQETSQSYFKNFPIYIENKIPKIGNGLNGDNVYVNNDGKLVIEFINMLPGEQVEIQVASSGTIYEAAI